MPDYDKSTATEVVLTLPGTVIDENYSLLLLLWDVLPDQLDDKQKDNKLDYLLKRLRKAGKIWTERNEVTSIWHLTETNKFP